jgi:glyoxylase-like metal-dependent hydrolase (beta-lactamase superfamily II)
MKTRYKVLIGIGGVLVAVVVLATFFSREAAVPDDCRPRLDLARVRQLASSMPGEKPKEIRTDGFTTFKVPWRMVRGGDSLQMVQMRVYAYQLVYPDRTVILDAAMSQAQAARMGGRDYDAAAWKRLEGAMAAASAVYVTHEHGDHMGGVFAGALPPHARLTPEQLSSDRFKPLVIDEAAKKAVQPLVYEDMTALAPGLVAIKAPGHTPGSQWFFVTRADGRELLLVGDTAWQMRNIELTQGPPQLVSLMLKNDRHANACQLVELKALAAREPALAVMPGHDSAHHEQLVQRGLLVRNLK